MDTATQARQAILDAAATIIPAMPDGPGRQRGQQLYAAAQEDAQRDR